MGIKCKKASQWDGAFTLNESDTALVVAAKEGHKACVKILLEKGANPNVACDSEYIEGAAEWGEEDDGTDQFFYSALDVAQRAAVSSSTQSEIVGLLKEHGG